MYLVLADIKAAMGRLRHRISAGVSA
jgi:hypothetical protein